jgi:sensor histidine kinase regulating citrate/malate metabolism
LIVTVIKAFFTGFLMTLIFQIILLIVGILIFLIIPGIRNQADWRPNDKKYYISQLIIVNLYNIFVTGFMISDTYVYQATDWLAITGLFLLFILTTHSIIISSWIANIKFQRYLNIKNQYMSLIEELSDYNRGLQHNIDNHLTAIKSQLINSEEPDEILLDYVEDIDKERFSRDLMKMHNRVIAGFLYSKKKESLLKNIDFDILIKDYQIDTNMSTYELIDVLGTLIDNAFETGVKNNRVMLCIDKSEDRVIIQVMNNTPKISSEEINRMFEKGTTSKGDYHRGIGLYNLHKILTRDHAEIKVYNKMLSENFIVFELLILKNR